MWLKICIWFKLWIWSAFCWSLLYSISSSKLPPVEPAPGSAGVYLYLSTDSITFRAFELILPNGSIAPLVVGWRMLFLPFPSPPYPGILPPPAAPVGGPIIYPWFVWYICGCWFRVEVTLRLGGGLPSKSSYCIIGAALHRLSAIRDDFLRRFLRHYCHGRQRRVGFSCEFDIKHRYYHRRYWKRPLSLCHVAHFYLASY